jgi:peptidoglycan/xylan/chitin deacetylase (PgdA/CDA1 family)
MRIRGIQSLVMAARWARSRVLGGVPILGYHRIAEAQWDPYGLCVTPRHFAAQLEVLHRHANPIKLADLIAALQEGVLPPRAVALTFDDGYADVFTQARPLLDHYQIPATVFVTSDELGREYWWDEVARLVHPSQRLPEKLPLTIGATNFEWPRVGSAQSDNGIALVHALCDWLRPMTSDARATALEKIRTWSDIDAFAEGSEQRSMCADEVIAISSDGLIEIGSHTASHPVLAALPVDAQRAEILHGKAALEQLLQHPIASFSYPNGSVSPQTAALVQQAGFSSACASHWDVARPGSDLFHLPRFWVSDTDGAAFGRWLDRWLNTAAAGACA